MPPKTYPVHEEEDELDDDFRRWQEHPFTRRLMAEVSARISAIKEHAIRGAVTADPRSLASQAGKLEGLESVAEWVKGARKK